MIAVDCEPAGKYRAYGARWGVLLLFSVSNLVNAAMWVTFAPVQEQASLFYDVGASGRQQGCVAPTFTGTSSCRCWHRYQHAGDHVHAHVPPGHPAGSACHEPRGSGQGRGLGQWAHASGLRSAHGGVCGRLQCAAVAEYRAHAVWAERRPAVSPPSPPMPHTPPPWGGSAWWRLHSHSSPTLQQSWPSSGSQTGAAGVRTATVQPQGCVLMLGIACAANGMWQPPSQLCSALWVCSGALRAPLDHRLTGGPRAGRQRCGAGGALRARAARQ